MNLPFYKDLEEVVNLLVNQKLERKMTGLLTSILEKVCSKNGKDGMNGMDSEKIREIVRQEQYPVRTAIRLSMPKNRRVKKEASPVDRCKARIGSGMQCSRTRTRTRASESDLDSDSDFCRSHSGSLPYGRIDGISGKEPETPGFDSGTAKMGKRRGRRGKPETYQLADLNIDKYVQAILVKINGENYLVDQHDVIYRFNTDNVIVGKLNDNEIQWH